MRDLEVLRRAWREAGEHARGAFFAELSAGWLDCGPAFLGPGPGPELE